MKPYEILKVKKALVKPVYCFVECNFWSLSFSVV
jgi:hypothetical protein